jgi:5-hydroxyisourate hydrolase
LITISTHVLDTSVGRPAEGVPVVLERSGGTTQWHVIGHGETDADGRVRTLVPESSKLAMGVYRMVFDTRRYFEKCGVAGFYPSVTVVFEIRDQSHYHVPLLLSPFGYSTYRGS